MNYLAHAFLSNNNKDLLIGNFIADHLRGNDFSSYTPGIVEGIYLHRKIDAYTDAHVLFKASKRLFYHGFEKFSGVLVDIYFDHLLAKNFDRYSTVPLTVFSESVYAIYQEARSWLPHSSSRFLDYVLSNNIYTGYADLEAIGQVLGHLSNRIDHPELHLEQSVLLFKEYEGQLQENFELFFKDVIRQFMPSKPAPNGDRE